MRKRQSKKPKKMNLIFIILLYAIAAVLLGYGVYMAMYSMDYALSYSGNSSVAAENILQYVAGSCASYLGLGVLILTGAVILTTINRLQTNIYRMLYRTASAPLPNQEDSLIDDGQQLEFSMDELSYDLKNNPYYEHPKKEAEAISETKTDVEPERKYEFPAEPEKNREKAMAEPKPTRRKAKRKRTSSSKSEKNEPEISAKPAQATAPVAPKTDAGPKESPSQPGQESKPVHTRQEDSSDGVEIKAFTLEDLKNIPPLEKEPNKISSSMIRTILEDDIDKTE